MGCTGQFFVVLNTSAIIQSPHVLFVVRGFSLRVQLSVVYSPAWAILRVQDAPVRISHFSADGEFAYFL